MYKMSAVAALFHGGTVGVADSNTDLKVVLDCGLGSLVRALYTPVHTAGVHTCDCTQAPGTNPTFDVVNAVADACVLATSKPPILERLEEKKVGILRQTSKWSRFAIKVPLALVHALSCASDSTLIAAGGCNSCALMKQSKAGCAWTGLSIACILAGLQVAVCR